MTIRDAYAIPAIGQRVTLDGDNGAMAGMIVGHGTMPAILIDDDDRMMGDPTHVTPCLIVRLDPRYQGYLHHNLAHIDTIVAHPDSVQPEIVLPV